MTQIATVHMTVLGNVHAKESVRRNKYGGFYMPAETKDYMNKIKLAAANHRDVMQRYKAMPVSMFIIAEFTPPKSSSMVFQIRAIDGKILYTKRPDYDNIDKIVGDALQGIAFDNDSQIFKCTTTKQYAVRDCLHITLTYHEDRSRG